jgi:uncharacterized protein YceK
MRSLLIALVLGFMIAGCSTTETLCKEKPQVVKYKYIVNQVPAKLLEVPAPMYKLDLSTATDKDVALWMIDSEKRAIEIEQKLIQVKTYQDARLKELSTLPADNVLLK